jgi:ABC-type oligopeptide transport system substrate-binding subunit
MKKLLLVLLALFLIFALLSGCAKNDSEKSADNTSRFYYLEDTNNGLGYNLIIVDKETGVMYLFHGAGYKGGLTTMVDADGNPLIYDGEY